jgi:glycine/D-amino acid oxidase-like deaminating enzyme
VTVTVRGDHPILRASQLVIATGGWTARIAGSGNLTEDVAQALAGSMLLQRIPVYYFDYPAGMKDVIPVTFTKEGRVDMYAMPERRPGGGTLLKVGFHSGRVYTDPDSVPRDVEDSEKKEARKCMEDRLARRLSDPVAEVCLYAMTKEDIPLVGPVPGTRNTFVSTYGGGNCAKHAIALGKALSDLMQGLPPSHDLSEFSIIGASAK